MSKLKLCPLCGGEVRLDIYEHFYRVLCSECPAQTDWLYSEQEAIEAWNKRAERTCENESALPTFTCSLCGSTFFIDLVSGELKFCPHCGAKVVE